MTESWTPSSREQRFVWYAQMTMRYLVGGGGLVWEVTVDQLRTPLALVVFGALSSSADIFTFVRAVIKTAHGEREAFEEEIRMQDGNDEPRRRSRTS